MKKSIIITILAAILGLGMYVDNVHAAEIEVNCNMDPFALSDLLVMGVTDGDKLIISGVCVEKPGPGPSSFDIINSITLDGKGKGATIMNGNPVLKIAASKTVVVRDLTITGGNAPGNTGKIAGIDNNGTLTLIDSSVTGNSDGGGPESTGGIRNNGTLTLIDTLVSQNDVRSGGLPTGGILNLVGKTATLINSTVSLNTADTQGGPGTGGIHNQGLLVLSNSTVDENHAFDGSNVTGGIRNTGVMGMVMLFDSGVSKNTADGNSTVVGGIANNGGAVTLISSELSKNDAFGVGLAVGGIDSNGGTVTLINSELSKNTADGANNNIGGILSDGGLMLTGSTVTKNEAVLAATITVGGIAGPSGGASPNLTASQVISNIPNDCNFIDPACGVAP